MSVRNILDGTIKIEGGGGGGGGGEIPEDLRLKSLTADTIRCGEITADNIDAATKLETDDLRTRGLLVREPYFTLGDTRVLMQETDSEEKQDLTATLANGGTLTYTAPVQAIYLR